MAPPGSAPLNVGFVGTRLRTLLRRTAGWGLAGPCVFGAFGLIDAALVLHHGASGRLAVASFAVALALGVLVSFVCAVPAAGLELACSALARARPRSRTLWLAPVALVALAAWAGITLAPFRRPGWTLPAAVGFVAAIVASAGLARWGRRGAARFFALGLVAVALAVDVAVDPLNSDFHDLLGVVEICAALAALTELRRRVRRGRALALAATLAGLAGLAVLVVAAVDPLAPGWRLRSTRYGRMQPRLGRLGRALLDFDEDGFSSLLWGGDCDDRDPRRSPRAIERPDGTDRNCNGAVLPAHPTDADVGLEPPEGDPNMTPGAIDRVILLTVDCFRGDALDRAAMTPGLTRLARRGLRMRRMYTAGTTTATSLRFVQRVTQADPTFAQLLASTGVDSLAVFPVPLEIGGIVDGFSHAIVPGGREKRWVAGEVTAKVLAALGSQPSPRLVWAHYMDLHQPLLLPGRLDNQPLMVEGEVPIDYYAALVRVDRAIGELVAALEADGRMDRTLLVITGDHGESFGAHGVDYHGLDAYEELVHVPALVVAPGLGPGDYEELVTHRDLPPTILGAFGQVRPEGGTERFGRSWLRLRSAPSRPLHRFAVSYSTAMRVGNARVVPMAAITERHLKLTETFEDGLSEVFDLDADPHEADDLAPARLADAARLHHELALFRDIDGFY